MDISVLITIRTAGAVVAAIANLQSDKQMAALKSLRSLPTSQWTMLPGFTFSSSELADHSGLSVHSVRAVLAAFSLPVEERNAEFDNLHAFNLTNALPLLPRQEDEFTLFQYYSLVEALYESPFYWMAADKEYADTALSNRGHFTERFAREKLARVFGAVHTHANVRIFRKKGTLLGEIDALVLFGNIAIVLQAKSKRLTIEARKGNDLQIKSDFKKSVQDAYDQAYACAAALVSNKLKLRDPQGNEISAPRHIERVFPFCVVADHYPALAFQARNFLKYKVTAQIAAPLVVDVFALDAMTEMLESPLRLISYLSLRSKFGEKLVFMHELTILSYHLRYNLWISDDLSGIVLEDDIAAPLDVAMAVRRDGIPGQRTPDGILTRFMETPVGRLLSEIESRPDPSTLKLGLLLLELSQETIETLNNGIGAIRDAVTTDGAPHDFTAGFGAASSGLTIHCNLDHDSVATQRLKRHCEARKYSEKADRWFGIAIRPDDASIRFGITLDYAWQNDSELDALVSGLPKGRRKFDLRMPSLKSKRKPGRNDPCPCGSGLKFKKCCLNRM